MYIGKYNRDTIRRGYSTYIAPCAVLQMPETFLGLRQAIHAVVRPVLITETCAST